MKMCFTGDSIMLKPPSENYFINNELIDIIKSCEIKSTNLEMVLLSKETFASTFCGGLWLAGSENIIDYIKEFDFNHYSMSNNHTMDYSYDGLFQTIDILDKNKLAHSGSGKSLEEASNATIIQTNDNEKVAFISCTASCDDAARAGNYSNTVPARPGVNMLRHSERIYVSKADLEVIDRLREDSYINARFLKAVKMGIHSLPKEIHRLGRLEFVEGNETKKYTFCNKKDLERILHSIKEANNVTNNIIVNIHSHDIKADTDDTPDYYMEEFARACIDAGATAIIGTGTHQLKGIEIYKGKPIFYSIGNFMFDIKNLPFIPADYCERYNLDKNSNANNIWLKRTKNEKVGLEFDKANYFSILPIVEFNNNKITNIELIPLELGFSENEKGFPYIANKKDSKYIYNRLQELSTPYRTNFSFDNNKIILEL